MERLHISFYIDGVIEQEIQLYTDEYTPEQITKMMDTGEILTSINGPLVLIKNGVADIIGEIMDTALESGTLDNFKLNSSRDEY